MLNDKKEEVGKLSGVLFLLKNVNIAGQ